MVGMRDLETVNTTTGRPASPNKVRLGDRVRQPSFGVVCDGERLICSWGHACILISAGVAGVRRGRLCSPVCHVTEGEGDAQRVPRKATRMHDACPRKSITQEQGALLVIHAE